MDPKKKKKEKGQDPISLSKKKKKKKSIADIANDVDKIVNKVKKKKSKPLSIEKPLSGTPSIVLSSKKGKSPKKPAKSLNVAVDHSPVVSNALELVKKNLTFSPKDIQSTIGEPQEEKIKAKKSKTKRKDNFRSGVESQTLPETPKTPKKTQSKDNFKQITLHESLLARGLVSAEKSAKKKPIEKAADGVNGGELTSKKLSKLLAVQDGKKTVEKSNKKHKTKLDKGSKEIQSTVKPSKLKKENKKIHKLVESNQAAEPKPEKTKKKPKPAIENKKAKKMDVVEKQSNNQKFFGPTIDISDNSSDSAELKIATNDDDSSELSSEYDSSDSEHIMKNIKSFNKKGASKTPSKKENEPPPPKPKPKIYSSSEDDDDEDGDEDDDIDEEEKDDMEVDDAEDPIAKPDADDVFLDGWTKADVQELLNRMRKEIPKNDFVKAATRRNQLNWEKIKFGSHTAVQCYDKWKAIEKKIRGYRILEELLSDAEQWLEQPWTDFRKGGKNKNKVQKHPEMPKKPLTTYMIFYMKKKDKIAKEFPGLSLTDLSKVIAERFNKLPPNKKAKYNEIHLAMKEEYAAKMAKFAEAHPTEMARVYSNGSRHKKRNASSLPGWSGCEKPVPPLKLFLNEKANEHINDPNYVDILASYKEKWKQLSAKKKLPFIRYAHEQETKYLEDMKAYLAAHPGMEMPKYKSVLSKPERNILAKTHGKPDKPPSSAYLLFSKKKLRDPSIKGSTPKERMQEVAKLWKTVPESEKELYKKKVAELIANYKLNYASYLESLTDDQRKEEEEENRKGTSKRKEKDSEELAPPPPPKRPRAAAKKQSKLTYEDIAKRAPKPPPKDTFELFSNQIKEQFPGKNFPEKEIKKSYDGLLEGPLAELQENLDKMKQTYLVDIKRFLKSLSPEELQIYSSKGEASQDVKAEVKLSESEGSDEEGEDEEDSEEEDDDDEDVVEVKKKLQANAKVAEVNTAKKHNSSDESEDEEEAKDKKSSSSSSSSESSSDEEGSSSSSSSSTSSGDEDEAEENAAAF